MFRASRLSRADWSEPGVLRRLSPHQAGSWRRWVPSRTEPQACLCGRCASSARRPAGPGWWFWGGLTGDPGEDVVVDLARFLQVQEMAGAVDNDHAGGCGEQGRGAAGQACCDAAVVGPVQVEGGLWCLAVGRLLLGYIERT